MFVRKRIVTRSLVTCLLLVLSGSGVEAKGYDPLAIDPKSRSELRDLTVHDGSRNREIPVRVYLPGDEKPAPIVLFSHGLGGSRAGSRFLGEHWAARDYTATGALYRQALELARELDDQAMVARTMKRGGNRFFAIKPRDSAIASSIRVPTCPIRAT